MPCLHILVHHLQLQVVVTVAFKEISNIYVPAKWTTSPIWIETNCIYLSKNKYICYIPEILNTTKAFDTVSIWKIPAKWKGLCYVVHCRISLTDKIHSRKTRKPTNAIVVIICTTSQLSCFCNSCTISKVFSKSDKDKCDCVCYTTAHSTSTSSSTTLENLRRNLQDIHKAAKGGWWEGEGGGEALRTVPSGSSINWHLKISYHLITGT